MNNNNWRSKATLEVVSDTLPTHPPNTQQMATDKQPEDEKVCYLA